MKANLTTLSALACTLMLSQTSAQFQLPSTGLAPQLPASNMVVELNDGTILAADASGTHTFANINDYVASPFFHRNGKRCNSIGPNFPNAAPSDCSSSNTNTAAESEPTGGAVYQIPVVWHVFSHKNGSGNIPDSAIFSQMDILNEDFRAISGSLGASGTDTRIEFVMATTDPTGNAHSGITRHSSNSWYNDKGSYYSSVGWDTNRYLNIYTNLAGGNLGYAYVPSGGGVVGQPWDGVRMLWSSVGANAPIGAPYDLGRTTTHEVGHYLGLYHTFAGGCASQSGCSSNGDLICDTNPEASPNYSPCSRSSCGSSDPTNNYMDYSDDLCMTEFTPDQANRMRCTLDNFRVDLGGGVTGNASPSVNISAPSNGTSVVDDTAINFSGNASDPEDGNLTSAISWSSNLDGALGSGSNVTATLSVGTHTVTASVTDSEGASGSDTVSVTVTPVGGGSIDLSTFGYKVKGKHRIDLTWTGAAGTNVEVFMDGSSLGTTANDGAVTVTTSNKGGATYTFQLCETGGGACSNIATVVF